MGLLDDEVDIFTLKNVPKVTTMPNYVASRKRCKNFDNFEPLFLECQKDLRLGRRKLIKFQNEWQIKKGYYFILKGVLLYIAPLDIIEEAVGLIVSGRIVEYRYDYKKESIVDV